MAKNVVVNRLILETINVGYVVPVLFPTRMRSEGPEKANITTSVVWIMGHTRNCDSVADVEGPHGKDEHHAFPLHTHKTNRRKGRYKACGKQTNKKKNSL